MPLCWRKKLKRRRKMPKKKGKETVNNKIEKKKIPVYNGTFMKNIVYKEVLTA